MLYFIAKDYVAERPAGSCPKNELYEQECIKKADRSWGRDGLLMKPPGRRKLNYMLGFVWFAAAGCAGAFWSVLLLITRTSTRRLAARPALVLLVSTGLSLPSPTI